MRRLFGIGLICILIAATLTCMNLSIVKENTQSIKGNYTKQIQSSLNNKYKSMVPHASIVIEGNLNFTAANGVSGGTGTIGNPYIIQNWLIDATGNFRGVYIGNSTAYFVLRNCSVLNVGLYGLGIYSGSGISLFNVKNATIDNNVCSLNYYGMNFQQISNVRCNNNTCSQNAHYGMYLNQGSNDWICNGTYYDNSYYGIDLSSVPNSKLINNNCSNNQYGIYLSSSNANLLLNNTCNYNSVDGIYMQSSIRTNLTMNTLDFNTMNGIEIYLASYTILSKNKMVQTGLYINGNTLINYLQTIDASNSINNKPIYYYKNQSSMVIPADAGSIILANCTGATVQNHIFSNCSVGIEIVYSSQITIKNNLNLYSNYGILLYHSQNNLLINNNCTGNTNGIELYNSQLNDVGNNNAWKCQYGINLMKSPNNNITNDTCKVTNYGVYLSGSNNNNVLNNNCQNGIYGVLLDTISMRNRISNNTCIKFSTGIGIFTNSFFNVLINNTCIDSYYRGIDLSSNSMITMMKNKFINCGLYIGGTTLKDFIQIIDSTNTVNGKPIYYYKNQTTTLVPLNAGEVILVNCTSFLAANLDITNSSMGIELAYSSLNNINSNILTNDYYGICLFYSNTNIISTNNCSSSRYYSIYLTYSSFNRISDNTMDGTYYGIYTYQSTNCTIENNNCSNVNDNAIYLYYSSNSIIANNTCVNGTYVEIFSEYSQNDLIKNNTCIGGQYLNGIVLSYSTGEKLMKNKMYHCGLYIYSSNLDENIHSIDSTNSVNGKPLYYYKNLTAVSVPSNAGEIILANCTNFLVQNFIFTNSSIGIEIAYCANSTIKNNYCLYDSYGFFFEQSSNITISANNCSNCLEQGINLDSSTKNIIKYNNCWNDTSDSGIYLDYSPLNTLDHNTCSNNPNGIYLDTSSDSNIVTNNTLNMDQYGIEIDYSSGNKLNNNIMKQCGIELAGEYTSNYIQNISTSNTVNGKPVYYYKNQNSGTTPSNAGEVILSNCTNFIVKNLVLSNTSIGIELAFTNNTLIKNNVCNNNRDGIRVLYSSRDIISFNNLTYNLERGIFIDYSSYIHVYKNNFVMNARYGEFLLSNSGGIKQQAPKQGMMKPIQAFDSSPTDFWNDTDSKGNYWSNYSDLYPLAKNNGIVWDTPYELYSESQFTVQDNYPLVNGIGATKPMAPSNPQAVPGDGKVLLKWNPPNSDGMSPIKNYKIYRSTSSGSESYLTQVGNVLNYTDTNVTNGLTYYYKISAVNYIGEGPNSTEVNAKPQAGLTVPGAPQNLAATPGDTQIVLDWQAPSSDGGSKITNYNIFKGTASGAETFLTKIGNLTTYISTGLTNNIKYYYKVSAVNILGTGPNSTEVNATPHTGPSIPSIPKNLQALAGNAQITLNWQVPTSNGGSEIMNYSIYKGTSANSESFLLKIGNTTTYTDVGLTNSVTYYYKVTASNAIGESAKSNEANATPATTNVPPSTPVGLGAIAGNAQVTLSWSAGSSGGTPTNYNVYRSLSKTGTYILISSTVSTLFIDTSLTNNQTYWYKVNAQNSYGFSANTSEISATPSAANNPPGTPTTFTATIGNKQVSLSWSAPSSGGSPTNYNLYKSNSSTGIYSKISSPTTLSYTDTGLTNGQTYWYKVNAQNIYGYSSNTSAINATPSINIAPSIPTGLVAISGDGEATLFWNATTTGGVPTHYNVYRSTIQNGNYTMIASPLNSTYVDSSLTNGQTYWYKVNAENQYGVSANTSSVAVVPNATGNGGTSGFSNLALIAGIVVVIIVVLIIFLLLMRKQKSQVVIPPSTESGSVTLTDIKPIEPIEELPKDSSTTSENTEPSPEQTSPKDTNEPEKPASITDTQSTPDAKPESEQNSTKKS